MTGRGRARIELHARNHLRGGSDPIPGLCDCEHAFPYDTAVRDDNVTHWWRFREASYATGTSTNYTPDVLEEDPRGTPSMGGNRMVFSVDGAGTLSEITELETGPSPQSYSIRRLQGGSNASNLWDGQAVASTVPTGAGDPFTVEGWWKFTTLAATYDVLNFTSTTDDYIVVHSDGSLTLGRDGTTFVTAAAVVVVDRWYYLAVVGDGATIRLYVNPAADLLPLVDDADPAVSASGATVFAIGTPNGAGGSGGAAGGAFQGHVAEVALYDQALTPERIRVHYLAGLYGDTGNVPVGEQIVLDDISDVDTTGVVDTDVLTYQAATATWVAAAPGAAALALDDLTDVATAGETTGDVLTFNGTSWDPAAPTGGTVAHLDDIGDVVSPTPSDGDALVYDSGSSHWVPGAPAAAGSASASQVDTYTATSATWTMPAGAKAVEVVCVGAGGGGGGGGKGSSQVVAGTGGGGGGGVTRAVFRAADLTGTVAVVAGTGGGGGSAGAGTSPTTGSNGTASTFGAYLMAGGGGGGQSGSTGGGGGSAVASSTGNSGAAPTNAAGTAIGSQSTSGGAAGAVGQSTEWGGAGGGGASTGGGGAGQSGGGSIFGGPGGGGGGAVNASNVGTAGGAGGGNQRYSSGGGGGAGAIGGAGGNGAATPTPYCGQGGGGGGGGTAAAGGTAGTGGIGAGGGGGGAGSSGNTGQAGGQGGNGRVIVITYF